MSDIFAALLPPVVVAALFVALVVTALRATDWAETPKAEDPAAGPGRASSASEPDEDNAG